MPRPTALIEISNVLLFPKRYVVELHDIGRERVNYHLLSALKQQGIYDLYLFSDDRYDLEENIIRAFLLDYHLKQKGFKVHAILTALDLLWADIDEAESLYFCKVASHDFYDRHRKSFLAKAHDFMRLEAKSATQTESKLKRLIKQIQAPQPEKQALGQGYLDTLKCVERSDTLALSRNLRAKAYTAYLASKLITYPQKSIKEQLLQLFMINKPIWVGQVILFANDSGSTQLFQRVNAVPPNQLGAEQAVSAFFLKDAFTLDKRRYVQMLVNAFRQCQESQVINRLFLEIQRLEKTESSWFLASPSLKSKALSKLFETITSLPSDCDKTVADVVSEWLQEAKTYKGEIIKTNAELLAMQRSHWTSGSESTRSKRFIEGLLQEHGDLRLGVQLAPQDEVVTQSTP